MMRCILIELHRIIFVNVNCRVANVTVLDICMFLFSQPQCAAVRTSIRRSTNHRAPLYERSCAARRTIERRCTNRPTQFYEQYYDIMLKSTIYGRLYLIPTKKAQ